MPWEVFMSFGGLLIGGLLTFLWSKFKIQRPLDVALSDLIDIFIEAADVLPALKTALEDGDLNQVKDEVEEVVAAIEDFLDFEFDVEEEIEEDEDNFTDPVI